MPRRHNNTSVIGDIWFHEALTEATCRHIVYKYYRLYFIAMMTDNNQPPPTPHLLPLPHGMRNIIEWKIHVLVKKGGVTYSRLLQSLCPISESLVPHICSPSSLQWHVVLSWGGRVGGGGVSDQLLKLLQLLQLIHLLQSQQLLQLLLMQTSLSKWIAMQYNYSCSVSHWTSLMKKLNTLYIAERNT